MATFSINDVKTAVQYLSNKDQITGYWQANRFNSACKTAQIEEINFQRPNYEKGMISSDTLGLIKTTKQLSLDRVNGTFDKPSDYMWFSVLRVFSYGKNESGETVQISNAIDLLSDAEWAERRNDPFEQPTADWPAVKEQATVFKFYPTNIFRAELDYLKTPADPVWGYTVSNNVQVYDSGTSVQFSLPPHLFSSIVWRVCRLMGITVRQEDLVNVTSALIPQVDPT